jgi:hypothetical protein
MIRDLCRLHDLHEDLIDNVINGQRSQVCLVQKIT